MSRRSWTGHGDGFHVAGVDCDDAHRGYDADEEETAHVLVMVRRGAFLRRSEGREVLLDPTTAYLSGPGVVEQFAHPFAGGDACTAIGLAPELLASLSGGDPDLVAGALPVDGGSELALRRVTRLARRGEDAEGALAEAVVGLLSRLVGGLSPPRADSGRPATAAARRRLLAEARAELEVDPTVGLVPLARKLGCSPHHLSRIFSELTGAGFARYRNRLRLSTALERLEQGEDDLAGLAAELGFADHAHLTRTVRALVGTPPQAVRRLLAGDAVGREPAGTYGE